MISPLHEPYDPDTSELAFSDEGPAMRAIQDRGMATVCDEALAPKAITLIEYQTIVYPPIRGGDITYSPRNN